MNWPQQHHPVLLQPTRLTFLGRKSITLLFLWGFLQGQPPVQLMSLQWRPKCPSRGVRRACSCSHLPAEAQPAEADVVASGKRKLAFVLKHTGLLVLSSYRKLPEFVKGICGPRCYHSDAQMPALRWDTELFYASPRGVTKLSDLTQGV